jgi:hypothetical protein
MVRIEHIFYNVTPNPTIWVRTKHPVDLIEQGMIKILKQSL